MGLRVESSTRERANIVSYLVAVNGGAESICSRVKRESIRYKYEDGKGKELAAIMSIMYIWSVEDDDRGFA